MIRKLLSDQVPQWADLPITRVHSSGTDNALFRLGDELVLRIPIRQAAVALLCQELDWLPHLANLPLEIPTVRYRGVGAGYEFGIYDWIDGKAATPENVSDTREAAMALAGFLRALQLKATEGAPRAGTLNNRRGVPLAEMTGITAPAIEMLSDEIDTVAALDMWTSATAERCHPSPLWLHGDLKADNLLTKEGRLSAVIDWGLSAIGDPAADYASAWSWVDPSACQLFREVLELDDSEWRRAKGWALYGAVIALSYYRDRDNKPLCQQSRHTLARLGLLL
ncbi:aminoglycoside phosphotransferase family protein [Rhizobium tumorigenes]|uniref:Aminoglycoside phosphotransferase family protein n=1 Tax=Rhizobium tumorigenes TaxID=2041385 RepID=A0AAF1K5V7_9HYPH|nr:aminoglycoside phosphotransferase family protein [Rhizobium tumorigenes]WFR95641.1 aminoglycoside phosphotransferase family protein [Rhizobium tumorigenes]